jgi:transcription initiation factor TFIID subunit 2
MDVDRPPIGRISHNSVPSADDIAFVKLKAPLVLFMLDKRMLKGGPSLGLNRVIPKIMLSAMSGELGVANAITTSWFIRTCRKVSGIELRTFASQWIYPLVCICVRV